MPKIKYPKLFLLFLSFLFAYLIISGESFQSLAKPLFDLGYGGAYLLGLFFAYGFTAAPATVLLIKLSDFLGDVPVSLLGGIGALTADLVLFHFIRHSFADEIKEFSNEELFKKFYYAIPMRISEKVVPVLGGLIIASPLPDEIGVAILASSFNVNSKTFVIMSFVLNTLGIYFLVSAF